MKAIRLDRYGPAAVLALSDVDASRSRADTAAALREADAQAHGLRIY